MVSIQCLVMKLDLSNWINCIHQQTLSLALTLSDLISSLKEQQDSKYVDWEG